MVRVGAVSDLVPKALGVPLAIAPVVAAFCLASEDATAVVAGPGVRDGAGMTAPRTQGWGVAVDALAG